MNPTNPADKVMITITESQIKAIQIAIATMLEVANKQNIPIMFLNGFLNYELAKMNTTLQNAELVKMQELERGGRDIEGVIKNVH